MHRLKEVEEAKATMIEALDWSVMKWLREKKTVRKMADRANAALDTLNEELKSKWGSNLRLACDHLSSRDEPAEPSKRDARTDSIVKQVKSADNAARKARADAEQTFDDAEKQLSTTLAREGCRKAIVSWELHEKAIDLAETAISARK